MKAEQKTSIIALANANGIDTDNEGDIFGSTNGALLKFAEALLAAPAAAQLDAELPPPGLRIAHAELSARLEREAAENLSLRMENRQYAERIRLLEREKAERARGLVGSIGDYTGFCSLLDGYGQALVECETAGYYREPIARKDGALAALIAYIDGRTAGTAPKKFGCHCDLEPHMEPDGCVIDTNRREDCLYARKHATKEACEYWQPIKFAAAPSPQENTK